MMCHDEAPGTVAWGGTYAWVIKIIKCGGAAGLLEMRGN